jgi:hypothetical protein
MAYRVTPAQVRQQLFFQHAARLDKEAAQLRAHRRRLEWLRGR